MKAQGTFSRGSQKPGQKSEHDGFLRSRELAGEREGEKERKKERHRDASSDGTRVFYSK